MGPPETEKDLSKEPHQQEKMAVYRKEKDLHQPYIGQSSDFQIMQKTQETSHQKNKQCNRKAGYRPNRELLTESNLKWLKVMFNILSHQRKANQNNSVIPFYTCQNGQDQKH